MHKHVVLVSIMWLDIIMKEIIAGRKPDRSKCH